MAKPVVKKEAAKKIVVVSKDEKLIVEARLHFKELQQSWFRFAKVIWEIRTLEAYKETYDSFKDYANAEFPSMDYTTLLKFCLVAENFSAAIEDKMKKDDTYILPSYHSFYLVAGLKEDTLKKEEISKLRKMVLDATIGYHSLREKLKSMVHTKSVERHAITSGIEDIERNLEMDLEKDKSLMSSVADEDYDDLEVEDREMDEDEIDEDEDEDTGGATVFTIQARVTYLIENLPDFENELTKKLCKDSNAVDLADSMNALHKIMDKFLNKFEKLSE